MKLTRVLNGYHVTVSDPVRVCVCDLLMLNFLPLFLVDMVDPSTNLYPDIRIIFRPSISVSGDYLFNRFLDIVKFGGDSTGGDTFKPLLFF